MRVRGDRLVVSARFAGRGEATRLHLLVHDVRGGRWVEACLERGRPGVRLERDGQRAPAPVASRRARAADAWTYRLVLAAPSSTWPWRTPSSASREPAPPALVTQCGTFRRPRCDSHGEGRDRRGPHPGAHVSIGLFALWVGWPAGLALYACGRAVRVMRRDL